MNERISIESVAYYCQVGAALFFLLPGLLFIFYNYIILIYQYMNKKNSSYILLLGSLLAFIGLLMIPMTVVRQVSWLPFLLDPGSWVLAAALFGRHNRR